MLRPPNRADTSPAWALDRSLLSVSEGVAPPEGSDTARHASASRRSNTRCSRIDGISCVPASSPLRPCPTPCWCESQCVRPVCGSARACANVRCASVHPSIHPASRPHGWMDGWATPIHPPPPLPTTLHIGPATAYATLPLALPLPETSTHRLVLFDHLALLPYYIYIRVIYM